MLKFKLTGQDLQVIDIPIIAAKSEDYLTCEFEFEESVNSLQKLAFFKYRCLVPFAVEIIDGKCKVPNEVAKDRKFTMSLLLTDGTKKITSTIAAIEVEPTGEMVGVTPSPTDEVYFSQFFNDFNMELKDSRLVVTMVKGSGKTVEKSIEIAGLKAPDEVTITSESGVLSVKREFIDQYATLEEMNKAIKDGVEEYSPKADDVTLELDGNTFKIKQDVIQNINDKVDKENGKSLVSDSEISKLATVAENANNYVLPSDVVKDANYVSTDNNYTTEDKTKLNGVANGAQVNVIENVTINGVSGTTTNKTLAIELTPEDIGAQNKLKKTELATDMVEVNLTASTESGLEISDNSIAELVEFGGGSNKSDNLVTVQPSSINVNNIYFETNKTFSKLYCSFHLNGKYSSGGEVASFIKEDGTNSYVYLNELRQMDGTIIVANQEYNERVYFIVSNRTFIRFVLYVQYFATLIGTASDLMVSTENVTFQPYYSGIRTLVPQEITSTGNNLFDVKQINQFTKDNVYQIDGSFHFLNNDDYSKSVGNGTESFQNFLRNLYSRGITEYYVSFDFEGMLEGRIYAFLGASVFSEDIVNGKYSKKHTILESFFNGAIDKEQIILGKYTDDIDCVISNVMISLYDTDYEPYKQDTMSLDYEQQLIDLGYSPAILGYSVGDIRNTIDKNGLLTVNVELNGSDLEELETPYAVQLTPQPEFTYNVSNNGQIITSKYKIYENGVEIEETNFNNLSWYLKSIYDTDINAQVLANTELLAKIVKSLGNIDLLLDSILGEVVE